MREHQLTVPRTARFYTLGTPSGSTRRLWLVCHGYGQLARYFIRNFEVLDDGETVVVAPEGLSRFYLNGFSGRIGATWMTKEDRLSEIEDQAAYLNLLLEQLLAQVPADVELHVLGFSQGTATVCRWLATNKTSCHHLVLWAGAFPEDIDFTAGQPVFGVIPTTVVYGKQDEFITTEKLQRQQEIMRQLGIEPTIVTFEGGHTIDAETLKRVANAI